jgi:hypothetical protein
MSTFASDRNRNSMALRTAELRALAVACIAVSVIGAPAGAQPRSKATIPELASASFAWLGGGEWRDPPAGMRGPIRNDPAYPYHGNNDGPGRITVRISNWKDPVLKPWAAAQMKASNDEVHSGKVKMPFTAQSRCYPGGVPGQLLYPAEPFYFIQTPTIVYMIWQRDHMVRRIRMTDKHSEAVKPSWFGESIGSYENDGTLVVDTIGLSTKNSYVDNYRTPHTEKLHVIERFTLAADGKSLGALVKIEDPDTFNEPLYMAQRWRKVPNPLLETVCAENNEDHYGQNLFPIPQATKPDF